MYIPPPSEWSKRMAFSKKRKTERFLTRQAPWHNPSKMAASAYGQTLGPSDCLLFRLSLELRLMIYEELLVQKDRPLKHVNAPSYYFGPIERNDIRTNIIQTCRAIYDEAVPILYGSNVFSYESLPGRSMLQLPEHHLSLLKHAKVIAYPFKGGNTLETAACIQSLAGPDVSLDDLSIHIEFPPVGDGFYERDSAPWILELYKDDLLFGDNPILSSLRSLKSVKKLYIELQGGARFQPGFANELKEQFMKNGTRKARSIVIEKDCDHEEAQDISRLFNGGRGFDYGIPCAKCGNTMEDFAKGTAKREYTDDNVTDRAVAEWTFMNRVLTECNAEEFLVPDFDTDYYRRWDET